MKLSPDHRTQHIKAGSAECARLCRKPDPMLKYEIDAERRLLREMWEEARYKKSVKQREREAEALRREREKEWRYFRVKMEEWGGAGKAKYRVQTSSRAIRPSKLPNLLPAYGFIIRDHEGLLFPFQRTLYSKASATKQGRGRQLVNYGVDGAHVFAGGSVAFKSNVGFTREEIGDAFEQLELVNRSAAKNAKIVHHMIVQSLYELTPEEQFAMAKRYCERVFATQGLPYSLAMHAPDPEGDQRNWHFHIAFSYRPMERIAEGEWSFGRFLRTDLDNPEGWKHMRFLLAEELNHSCKLHGLSKRYTHLSYAASGLDYEPQAHLGPGLTAKVRRGEMAAKNAENHRRVAENTARYLVREMKAKLLETAAACRGAIDDKLAAIRLAAAVQANFAARRPFDQIFKNVTTPTALHHPQPMSAENTNDNNAKVDAGFAISRIPEALRPAPDHGERMSLRRADAGVTPAPLTFAKQPATIFQSNFPVTQIPAALTPVSSAIAPYKFYGSVENMPARLKPQQISSFSLLSELTPPSFPAPSPPGNKSSNFTARAMSLTISHTMPAALTPSPGATDRLCDLVKTWLPANFTLPAALDAKRMSRWLKDSAIIAGPAQLPEMLHKVAAPSPAFHRGFDGLSSPDQSQPNGAHLPRRLSENSKGAPDQKDHAETSTDNISALMFDGLEPNIKENSDLHRSDGDPVVDKPRQANEANNEELKKLNDAKNEQFRRQVEQNELLQRKADEEYALRSARIKPGIEEMIASDLLGASDSDQDPTEFDQEDRELRQHRRQISLFLDEPAYSISDLKKDSAGVIWPYNRHATDAANANFALADEGQRKKLAERFAKQEDEMRRLHRALFETFANDRYARGVKAVIETLPANLQKMAGDRLSRDMGQELLQRVRQEVQEQAEQSLTQWRKAKRGSSEKRKFAQDTLKNAWRVGLSLKDIDRARIIADANLGRGAPPSDDGRHSPFIG